MRFFTILVGFIIVNLLVALAFLFFSPTIQNPTLNADNILNAIMNLPEYWLDGAKGLPHELTKLSELVMKVPKAILDIPLFWGALIATILTLYLLLMSFFSSMTGKVLTIFFIVITVNLMALECNFSTLVF